MVEVLRHSGIRIEELTELCRTTASSSTGCRATGERIPLLQITPSKTDTERLLVIAPDLADGVSPGIRDDRPDVALVVSYDKNERVYNPPMPLLFQSLRRCRPWSVTDRTTTDSKRSRCPNANRAKRYPGGGRRDLRQRPEVLPRRGEILGRREPPGLGGDHGHPRTRIRRQSCRTRRRSRAPVGIAVATAWFPSRSSRAGNAAIASAASTTCVSRMISTASSVVPRRHGQLHGLSGRSAGVQDFR